MNDQAIELRDDADALGVQQVHVIRLAGGPERRYYTMTAKGRALMRRKIAMWQGFSSAMTLVLKASGA